MTKLINVLEYDIFDGLSDAQVLSLGNELITQTSNTPWSWDKIVRDVRFGKEIADQLYNLILSTNGVPAATFYINYGIDLSLPQSQIGLTAIANAAPILADTCNTLKRLGVWEVTRWVFLGIECPTLNDITEARRIIALRSAKTYIKQNYLNSAFSDDEKTIADIQTIIMDSNKWGVI